MLIESKIFLFIAVIFMGIGFYTALAAAYRSDADATEDDSNDHPDDQRQKRFSQSMIILGFVCLFISGGLLIRQVLSDLKLI